MAFTPIDESTWERREYLEVFRQTAIYLTADVDITPLYQRTNTPITPCPGGTPRTCLP